MNIHKNARTTGRVSVLLRSRSHDLTNVALRAGCGLSEQRYAGRSHISDLSTRLCLARSAPSSPWTPDDEPPAALIEETAADPVRQEVFAVIEQMASHHPREPHWYLPLIGVDPIQQGKGLGSALMRHALSRCDREKKLAYLNSSNAKSIPLYEREGFERIGTIQGGTWPPLYPMVRTPR